MLRLNSHVLDLSIAAAAPGASPPDLDPCWFATSLSGQAGEGGDNHGSTDPSPVSAGCPRRSACLAHTHDAGREQHA
jgi:hypothetical protein